MIYVFNSKQYIFQFYSLDFHIIPGRFSYLPGGKFITRSHPGKVLKTWDFPWWDKQSPAGYWDRLFTGNKLEVFRLKDVQSNNSTSSENSKYTKLPHMYEKFLEKKSKLLLVLELRESKFLIASYQYELLLTNINCFLPIRIACKQGNSFHFGSATHSPESNLPPVLSTWWKFILNIVYSFKFVSIFF